MNSIKSADQSIQSVKVHSAVDPAARVLNRATIVTNVKVMPEQDSSCMESFEIELPTMEAVTKMLWKSQSYC